LGIKNSSFSKNKAKNGGAIIWNYREPIVGSDVTYSGNEASKYGDDIASIA
jgi:hypothetical protein